MPERMPLTVSVRPDQLKPALAALTLAEAGVLMQLVLWMSANAAALPYDFHECFRIVGVRSLEAAKIVRRLTGLDPVHRDVHVDGFLSTGTESCPRGQGLAFEGSPEHGLTLRSDTSWGIDALGAQNAVERARRMEREKKARWRAKHEKPVTRYVPVDVHVDSEGGLAGTRNSEEQIPIPIPKTEERALLLPSVVVAHAARALACEADVVPSEVSGERRGQALKAMRACGLTGINGLNPDFLALLAMGVSDDELRFGAEDAAARGKGFPYAVRAMLGARRDAQAGTPSGAAPRPAWVVEAEERAKGWLGSVSLGAKPP